MEFKHYSVMKQECLAGLNIKADGVYMDGTLGGGGHSLLIGNLLSPKGKLIMFDLDTDAIKFSKKKLENLDCEKYFINDNFKNFKSHIDKLGVKLDGVLLDLGVSSYQIDEPERGFSYINDGPLNMAMNKDADFTAFDVVNNYSQSELIKVIRDYGEEPMAARIAAKIVAARKNSPIVSTGQLAEIVASAISLKFRFANGHPAKRVFQAIRIEVNGELTNLKECLISLVRDGLNSGGRLAVLTFHSLEDRIAKEAFTMLASDCICDKKIPICVCKHKAEVKLINKKPIVAGEQEQLENSRSHSAKLRVVEKL